MRKSKWREKSRRLKDERLEESKARGFFKMEALVDRARLNVLNMMGRPPRYMSGFGKMVSKEENIE